MLSVVQSMSLQGLNGYLVSIQVDISAGLPNFEIVRFARYERKRSKRKSKNSNKKYAGRNVKQKNNCKFSTC